MGTTFAHIYGQLDQCKDLLDEDLNHLLDLGLVCDGSISLDQAEKHQKVIRRLMQSGGLIAPCFYPNTCDPVCRDPNWWRYSFEECVRLLKLGLARFEALGLGKAVAITTYTPGNEFIRACRSLGLRYLFGFCAPTVGEDGDWKISHYGSPLSPFFASEEDFRKPEDPGNRPDPFLMMNMELRSPLVCLRHWNEGPWCPLNAQAADRWLEVSDEPLSFEAMAEEWIRESAAGTDNIFHLNLQYFFAGECRNHNRAALEYLARQLKKGRIRNGSVRIWEREMREHGGFREQNTLWCGELPGFHVGHRPGFYPDMAVSENLSRQAVWMAPSPKPERLYDYTRVWHCAPFQPDGSDPASEDLSAFDVTFERKGNQLILNVDNHGPARTVPFLCFDAFEHLSSPFSVTGGLGTRILPDPSGTGACLMTEQCWPEGKTEVVFTLSGVPSDRPASVRRFGSLLEARSFEVEEKRWTSLASQTPEAFTARVRVNADTVHESLIGIDHVKPHPVKKGTLLELKFDGSRLAQYHRFQNILPSDLSVENREEIEAALRRKTDNLVQKLCPGLKISSPGYQLFGNIRESGRWDAELGRKAGEAELARIDEAFARHFPDAGKRLLSFHPGLFLPRGSMTRALCHPFNLLREDSDCRFEEGSADYPQGWDWGVAAYVQWRSLSFSVKNLSPEKRYAAYFHAVDAEGRNYAQKVFFRSGETQEGELGRWQLPVGIERRFDREAFLKVLLPEGLDKILFRIIPDAEAHPFNWVKTKEAPGVIYHFFLTEEN